MYNDPHAKKMTQKVSYLNTNIFSFLFIDNIPHHAESMELTILSSVYVTRKVLSILAEFRHNTNNICFI